MTPIVSRTDAKSRPSTDNPRSVYTVLPSSTARLVSSRVTSRLLLATSTVLVSSSSTIVQLGVSASAMIARLEYLILDFRRAELPIHRAPSETLGWVANRPASGQA